MSWQVQIRFENFDHNIIILAHLLLEINNNKKGLYNILSGPAIFGKLYIIMYKYYSIRVCDEPDFRSKIRSFTISRLIIRILILYVFRL